MNTTELIAILYKCSNNKSIVIITNDPNEIETINQIHTVVEYGDVIEIILLKNKIQ